MRPEEAFLRHELLPEAPTPQDSDSGGLVGAQEPTLLANTLVYTDMVHSQVFIGRYSREVLVPRLASWVL